MHLLLSISIALLGAILASFVGVVSERIHTGQSWSRARSRCNSCREFLGVRDLFPVLSWVATRGRCRHCSSKVPMQYPFFEALLATVFVLALNTLGISLLLLLFLSFTTVLSFIVIYDLRHMIVPPAASAVLFILSIVFAFIASENAFELGSTCIRAGAIALLFFLLHVFSRGRAMGLGDAPIALSLSLMAGSAAFAGLLFSFWIGAIVGIGILVLRRGGPTMGIEVPFVPFLAAGYLLAYFTQWNPLLLF